MDSVLSWLKHGVIALAGLIPCVSLGQVQTIYSLGVSLDGAPSALTRTADGSFYGILGAGGRLGRGSIFHLNADATALADIFDFADASTNETSTAGALVGLTNGYIYGVFTDFPTTGATNLLYRVATNGNGFAVVCGLPALYSSLLLASDGRFYLPTSSHLDRFELDGTSYVTLTNGVDLSRLLEGADGLLYGLANSQTIVRVHKDGSGLITLTNSPKGIVSLIQAGDGQLYGLMDNFPNGESAFKVASDGNGFQSLGDISADGQDSLGGSLLDGADGSLYATFGVGPAQPATRLIAINQVGGVRTVVNLPASYGNNSGVQAITLGADGRLYGSASRGGTNGAGVIYTVQRDGTGLTERFQFGGAPGSFIQSALLLGSDGRLYGTARQGGTGDRGMVFRLETTGNGFAVLKQFGSSAEGDSPRGGVIEGPEGVLYGTTTAGGTNGGGTVFRLNRDGTGFLTLAHFGPDTGTNPLAQLLLSKDGALYGSCVAGGTTPTNGTLWKVQTNGGGFTLLKKFAANGTEGRRPFAPLTEGTDGMLYGVTDGGGTAEKGVIFKLAKDGSSYQVLRSLTGFGDAANPEGRLLQLTDGTFIGTSTAGGTAGLGSIFRIQTNGAGYKVVHSFITSNADARVPVGGLTAVGDGSLLGTTRFGGGQAVGTVFSIKPDGTAYQVLYRFSTNYPSAQEPWAGLTPGPNGAFYGATTLGGLSFSGAIFSLQLGGPSRPKISILLQGSALQLSWPASAAGYQLQFNPDLSNLAGWQFEQTAPTLVDGNFNLTLPLSTSVGFYRLHQ